MNLSISELSHILIDNLTNGSGIYIDATAGNGHDSLFIAKMLKEGGELYSFDISFKAIENTKKLLEENLINTDKIKLINDGHENIGKYVHNNKIMAAMFNLGYLPGTDKKVFTKSHSTISALDKILNLLEYGGIVVICSYIGHDDGAEDNAIFEYLQNLNKKSYEISKTEMLLRECAPALYLIIKKDKR